MSPFLEITQFRNKLLRIYILTLAVWPGDSVSLKDCWFTPCWASSGMNVCNICEYLIHIITFIYIYIHSDSHWFIYIHSDGFATYTIKKKWAYDPWSHTIQLLWMNEEAADVVSEGLYHYTINRNGPLSGCWTSFLEILYPQFYWVSWQYWEITIYPEMSMENISSIQITAILVVFTTNTL